MKLYNYWGFIGSLAEIEDYVRIFDDNYWNGEPVPFHQNCCNPDAALRRI